MIDLTDEKDLTQEETLKIKSMANNLGYKNYFFIGIQDINNIKSHLVIQNNLPASILGPLFYEILKRDPDAADAFDDFAETDQKLMEASELNKH